MTLAPHLKKDGVLSVSKMYICVSNMNEMLHMKLLLKTFLPKDRVMGYLCMSLLLLAFKERAFESVV